MATEVKMDSEAYAAVKANDHRLLQKRLREAENCFPVNVGARNGAGLTMLHVGNMSSVASYPKFSCGHVSRANICLCQLATRVDMNVHACC